MKDLYLGYTDSELTSSPYAPFFKPHMAELPTHVKQALLNGAVAEELMPTVKLANQLQDAGYWPVETGYTLGPDRSARVSVLTHMPGVTPAMWDWWFGWHGSEAQRYKLWHPKAHTHVAWDDGCGETGAYVGRTSRVVEYIGASRLNLKIRFVPPSSLGLNEQTLQEKGEVAICARGSIAALPLETSWLIHHIRPVAGGSEMRSRFWVAGDNIEARGKGSLTGKLLAPIATLFSPDLPRSAVDLLVHCAQEMNHLAEILPDIYATFNKAATDNTIER